MAVQGVPANSVWSSMGYVPPRGACNYKAGIVSGTCSCLRFMLHPIKAATSFECDGCGHHASYHSMENPAEDAILTKWSNAAMSISSSQSGQVAPSNKRRRVAPSQTASSQITDLTSENGDGAPEASGVALLRGLRANVR